MAGAQSASLPLNRVGTEYLLSCTSDQDLVHHGNRGTQRVSRCVCVRRANPSIYSILDDKINALTPLEHTNACTLVPTSCIVVNCDCPQVGIYLLDVMLGLLFRMHYRPEVLFKRLGNFVEVSFKDVSPNKDTSSGYVLYSRELL